MEQKLDAGQEISRADIISLIKANDNAAKWMGAKTVPPNRSNELRRSNSNRHKSEKADLSKIDTATVKMVRGSL